MSIVDDGTHVLGNQARDEQLWRTPRQAAGRKAAQAPTRTPLAAVPDLVAPASSNAERTKGASLIAGVAGGDELWQARIDLVVSSGLSGDAARKAREHALREQSQSAFDALCGQCQNELRPVLEHSVAILQEWGLDAHVTETLRDEPARLPRSFELALRIARIGDRGPGKLTITATEACDFVRVKITVGPSKVGAEVNDHIGTTIARDLSGPLVGGLVATLVEQIFSQ